MTIRPLRYLGDPVSGDADGAGACLSPAHVRGNRRRCLVSLHGIRLPLTSSDMPGTRAARRIVPGVISWPAR
jgi:hypothetical protein